MSEERRRERGVGSWFAGPAHGLLWADGLALVSPEVALPAAINLWEAGPASIGDFIAELHRVAKGDSMPGFVAAMQTPTGWQIAVSPDFRAQVRGEECGELTHAGSLAWTQRSFGRIDDLILATSARQATLPDVDNRPGWRPATSALVPAEAVRWTLSPAGVAASAPPAEQPPVVSNEIARGHRTAEEPVDAAAPGSFAHLWADTAFAHRSAEPTPVPSKHTPPPAPTPAPPSGTTPAAGDHDGMTMLGPALREAEGPAPSVPAGTSASPNVPAGTPLVLAAACPNGHANPPQRPTCRLCNAPISAPPRQVARPSLGRLRFSNGDTVELTDPVIIGRKPRANQVTDRQLPRLCPIPRDHISGNHLQIRLEGWSVLAVDMHSTNGTMLQRRGEAPVRLPERPLPLRSGDVLDLGHGVWISLEEVP